jgi:hypothetical protein
LALNNRTSGLLLRSGVVDNEQLAYKGIGEFPAWIKEPAIADSQLAAGVGPAMKTA